MQNHRFADGNTIAFAPSRTLVQPYDPSIKFNRLIDRKGDDPANHIYSIDAVAILNVLREDKLEDLYKITLAGRPTRNGVGVWDTLFNNASKLSMSACVMMAQEDFSPIPQNRVVVSSAYLNLTMPVSRLHLNHVSDDDHVGIGIHDMTRGITYVLLYNVDESCSVVQDQGGDDRKLLIPSVNLRMEHAIKITYEGNATIIDMEEDKTFKAEQAMPFVQWINDVVYDVSSGYPWKPHFLTWTPHGFDRKKIEARLGEEKENAQMVSYADFEQICRKAYLQAKDVHDSKKQLSTQRRRPGARGNAPMKPIKEAPVLPMVEVVTYDDMFVAILDDASNPDKLVYSFTKEDMGTQAYRETFLSNADLEGENIDESSKLMVLSPNASESKAYLRYFTLNF